jgi:hypothetical protein
MRKLNAGESISDKNDQYCIEWEPTAQNMHKCLDEQQPNAVSPPSSKAAEDSAKIVPTAQNGDPIRLSQ